MSDQAFVKAFSRRRPKPQSAKRDVTAQQPSADGSESPDFPSSPAVNPEPTHTPPGTAAPADVVGTKTAKMQSDGSPAQGGSAEPGSLQLDQSVASTAQIWVDPIEDQMARADHPSTDIPRPHIDSMLSGTAVPETEHPVTPQPVAPIVTPAAPTAEPQNVETNKPNESVTPDRDHSHDSMDIQPTTDRSEPADSGTVDPMQHIHTAYATAYADASVLSEIQSFAIEPATEQDPVFPERDEAGRETETSPLSNDLTPPHEEEAPEEIFQAPTGDIPAPQMTDSVASTAAPSVEDPQEHPVYLPTEEESREPLTIAPFQAVWEVDVFDVPTPVADLFFEGTLFQQIAERMSEAVGSGLSSVLVTSTKAGEGRSSVAIGIAMAAAATGIRVALVDADTDDPTLADDLRLELQYGWVDTVRGGLPIKEVAVHAVEDGVTLIPLMPPSGRNAATAFEVVQLVELLKDKFELVIIDGPTAQSAHIHQCASIVDSAIIVRDMARTDTLAINEFSYRLRESGVLGVGVVENFV